MLVPRSTTDLWAKNTLEPERRIARFRPLRTSDGLIPLAVGPSRMVDRKQKLIEFVTAWAEYERRMTGIGSEAKKLAEDDPALHQMIARITDDLSSSPDVQRDIAKQLALAEISKSS
jgi:hypothetical protein